jgi:hypothetical protein
MSSKYDPGQPERYQYAVTPPSLREVQVVPAPETARPLVDPLQVFASLPADSLLFGLASDGLPLLLNLRDPQPGPILLIGDQGCGKTDFLKTLVRATRRLMPPGAVQFTVLTNFADEWYDLLPAEALLGVWEADQPLAADLLSQLEAHLHAPSENQPTILLFDGLESVQQLSSAAQSSLANLLMHGPHALIWPVVTVNASLALELSYWLSFFRTRLYGQILHQPTARYVTSLPGAPLGNLAAPNQFCLREKSHWLKFLRPSL